MHGPITDLNLVARGHRAVIKCTHYDNAFVVLYADPISDDKEYGTYTVQFAMVGVGSEVYMIPSQRLICPHYAYDQLVREMQAGARPAQSRIPLEQPVTQTAPPGQELPAPAPAPTPGD